MFKESFKHFFSLRDSYNEFLEVIISETFNQRVISTFKIWMNFDTLSFDVMGMIIFAMKRFNLSNDKNLSR